MSFLAIQMLQGQIGCLMKLVKVHAEGSLSHRFEKEN